MAILDSAGSNINIDGNVTSFTDFGGVDTYTILNSLSADVTIADNNISRINLPEGLDVSAVSFLSDGMQITVNGNTVTLLGNPASFSFVFGGTPLDANAGTSLDYQATAAVFGTTVPTAGSGPNNATNTGGVNADGSIGDGTGGGGLPILPTVSLAPTNGQTTEGDSGNTVVTFTATLSSASSELVAVDYATSSSSAQSGVDFLAASGSLVFSPGTTQRTFEVEIVGDTDFEPDEIFRVALSNPQGATLDQSSGSEALHAIQNDDPESDFSSTTNSFFENAYTFQIAGNSAAYTSFFEVITNSAIEVIEYISDYISWNGILDFVVNFDGPINYGPGGIFSYLDGNGLLPAYGGIAENGQTFAQLEALSGIDENGSDFDLGLYLLPNVNGTLTNFGSPLYFDPSPDAYAQASIPTGQHDFFSIFLHEVLHGLGFWSTAQHAGFGNSAFDDLTILRDGQYYFEGDAVLQLLGEGLPLATTGSRDHYGFNTNGPSPVERGTVFEFGNYEQNRWHLGQLELAVLTDLGFVTANEFLLPLVEEPDTPNDSQENVVYVGPLTSQRSFAAVDGVVEDFVFVFDSSSGKAASSGENIDILGFTPSEGRLIFEDLSPLPFSSSAFIDGPGGVSVSSNGFANETNIFFNDDDESDPVPFSIITLVGLTEPSLGGSSPFFEVV